MQTDTLLDLFMTGRLAPEQFGHREHVAVAYELLHRYPFDDALDHFSRGASGLAQRAGAPEKFHVTVTYALMLMIANDCKHGKGPSCGEYMESGPAVLRDAMGALGRHYSPERLWSEAARRSWVEPDLLPLPGMDRAVAGKAA